MALKIIRIFSHAVKDKSHVKRLLHRQRTIALEQRFPARPTCRGDGTKFNHIRGIIAVLRDINFVQRSAAKQSILFFK